MLRRTFFLLAVTGSLAACAQSLKPIDPNLISQPGELKAGRGLLSGDDGEFKLQL